VPDPRPRVVTLIDRLGTRGGAERLALQLASRLDPSEFDSTLCVSRWSPAEAADPSSKLALAELEERGTRFLPLGRTRKVDVWVWGTLAAHLRRERVDVLHAHKFGSNVWGTLIGRAARVPVVIAHEHTWSFEGRPERKFLDRELIARGTDAFIAVSQEDRRKMIEIERIDPDDVRFVPNGIPKPPPPSGHDVRAELGIAPGDPIVTTVGFLRPQKAFHVLVEAIALLRERHPGVRALIAGEGPERERLEQLVAQLGVGENVRLLGRRLDVPDLLAVSDVCVCCSDFEGSPLSVMEYMAAGRPVVATAVGGLPDLIDDGVHGRLVAPGDPRALAGAIGALLDDPQTAHAMGARGAERQAREFDLDAMVQRFSALYRELLAARR
jgi:glycosyltransferase involved in cell wall biosynthesis